MTTWHSISIDDVWRRTIKPFFIAAAAELARLFKTPYIYISTAMLALVGWLMLVETEDGKTELGILTLLGLSDSVLSIPASISSLSWISKYSSSGWFYMILVTAAAICLSISFCDERTSGMVRFSMSRCGKRMHIATKVTAAAAAGLLAALTGFLIFTLTALLFSPSFSSFTAEEQNWFLYGFELDTGETAWKASMLKRVLLQLASSCFNTVVWSLLSMAIIAIKPNKYFALCLPPVLWYFWHRILYTNFANFQDWYVLLDSTFDIAAHRNYFCSVGAGSFAAAVGIIALGMIRTAVPVILFYTFMNKRVDAGENA